MKKKGNNSSHKNFDKQNLRSQISELFEENKNNSPNEQLMNAGMSKREILLDRKHYDEGFLERLNSAFTIE